MRTRLAVGVAPPVAPAICGLALPRSLSPSVWLEIASFLNHNEFEAVRATAHPCYTLFDDDAAWRARCLAAAMRSGCILHFSGGSWRQTALGQRSSWQFNAPDVWEVCAMALPASAGGLVRVNWSASRTLCCQAVRPTKPAWLKVEDLGDVFIGWPRDAWTTEPLRRQFGDIPFTAVLPGAGKRYQMIFDEYLNYAALCTDFAPPSWSAEPLYIFEPKLPHALANACVPPRLTNAQDFASECPELRNLLKDFAHGWLLVGGSGSGSRFHVDTYACGAWNACLQGRKRWAMYPPGELPPGVCTIEDSAYAAPAPLFWFTEVLPALPLHRRPSVDIIQCAGEIIYVPPGWWHCVLNLDAPTVGFTRNVVYGPENARGVCKALDAINEFETAHALRKFIWCQHAEDDTL